METGLPQLVFHTTYLPWDARSRLKGIETISERMDTPSQSKNLGCVFPFEGNGNFSMIIRSPGMMSSTWDVRSRLKGMETIMLIIFSNFCRILGMCFPVWREWKHITGTRVANAVFCLGCAFPFEGNGNFCSMGSAETP